MRPVVIVHASVSIDGAMTGFAPDMGAHYGCVPGLGCDAHLVGSATMASGLSMGEEQLDPGSGGDQPPGGRSELPYWFLVDSRGSLACRLHSLRAFPGLRDVVVLISRRTPQAYRTYLAQRQYRTIDHGDNHVDLSAALEAMSADFGVQRVLVDSGPILTSALLDAVLVDEVSMLVHPVVAGAGHGRIFGNASRQAHLEARGMSDLPGGLVHLRYSMRRLA